MAEPEHQTQGTQTEFGDLDVTVPVSAPGAKQVVVAVASPPSALDHSGPPLFMQRTEERLAVPSSRVLTHPLAPSFRLPVDQVSSMHPTCPPSPYQVPLGVTPPFNSPTPQVWLGTAGTPSPGPVPPFPSLHATADSFPTVFGPMASPPPSDNRYCTDLSPEPPTGIRPENYKTALCRNWSEEGTCLFAQNCAFAHGEAELRRGSISSVPSRRSSMGTASLGPETPQTQRQRRRRSDLYKTMLCSHFQSSGSCPYTDTCNFAHGEGDMRPLGMAAMTPSPSPSVRVGPPLFGTPTPGLLRPAPPSTPRPNLLASPFPMPTAVTANRDRVPGTPEREMPNVLEDLSPPRFQLRLTSDFEEWVTPKAKDCMAAVGSEIASALGDGRAWGVLSWDDAGPVATGEKYAITPEMSPGTPEPFRTLGPVYTPGATLPKMCTPLAGVNIHFREAPPPETSPPDNALHYFSDWQQRPATNDSFGSQGRSRRRTRGRDVHKSP